MKLHDVNDKHGSASDQSDLDSLCLSDSGLASLAEGFPKLEKLRLIWCSNVTSEGLSSLARKCTSSKTGHALLIFYVWSLVSSEHLWS